MVNAHVLFFTGFASLIAFATSAPAGTKVHQIQEHSPASLDACKIMEYEEHFKADGDFINAPTDGPFVYKRFGIGYFNLARLNMNQHFGKHMIPTVDDDDENHGVAAIGASTHRNGQANGPAIAYFAIRPSSNVHAFKVKKIKYFCLQNNEPTSCTLGFKYSPATFEEQGTVDWYDIGIPGSGQGSSYAASWGSPPVALKFEQLPKLQLFSLGLLIPQLEMWNTTTPTTDKLDGGLNKNGTTAYLENVEFTVWECEDNLPGKPLGGTMGPILRGEFL